MVQTGTMGYAVHVQVTMKKSPSEHEVDVLDHQFGIVEHAHGAKVVTITEHVSVGGEADAIEFVRSLVLDAIPAGATITAISATSD
jgi:hypothetical protein